jgi:hypothetical protein
MRTLTWIIAIAVLTLPSAATAQTLESLIAATRPGKTLVLPPGFKGGGLVRSVAKSPPILVTGDRSVVLTDVKLQGASGIVFDGLEFASSGGAGFALAFTAGSNDSGVRNCRVHGPTVGAGNGIQFYGSTGGFVESCEIHDLSGGVIVFQAPRTTVTRNRIHAFSVDGFQAAASSDLRVCGNEFYDSFPAKGAHNDAMQVFTLNTTAPTKNLTFCDNVVRRGAGSVMQGVFLGNEQKIPYENVSITGNLLIGTMYNGIALHLATGSTVSRNTVVGYSDMVSCSMA